MDCNGAATAEMLWVLPSEGSVTVPGLPANQATLISAGAAAGAEMERVRRSVALPTGKVKAVVPALLT